jgi:hypothetical protein
MEMPIDQLEQRLTAQERRATRLTRVVVVLTAALFVMAIPLAAMAAHNFLDVPNTNQFHTDIERVSDARITGGCGGGNYCPSQNVTREQMAAFLARTGGRVGWGRSGSAFQLGTTPDQAAVLATVSLKPGNLTGGTGFVLLQASGAAYVFSTTGCPCAVRYVLGRPFGNSAYGYAQITAAVGTEGASISLVDDVPTGVEVTYQLRAWVEGGTGVVYASGSVTALYVPFSEDGDDLLEPQVEPTPTPVPG